jgi:hypothetical protein
MLAETLTPAPLFAPAAEWHSNFPPMRRAIGPITSFSSSGPTGRGGAGGAYPYAGLTFDSFGNLWGTTTFGGLAPYYDGVVFKLSPNATGPWTETVVHALSNYSGGGGPNSSLVFNSAGKLFGTTALGGALDRCTFYGAGGGCGLVFGIAP